MKRRKFLRTAITAAGVLAIGPQKIAQAVLANPGLMRVGTMQEQPDGTIRFNIDSYFTTDCQYLGLDFSSKADFSIKREIWRDKDGNLFYDAMPPEIIGHIFKEF